MRLPARLFFGLAAWLSAEFIVFAFIVEMIGFSGAVLLCIMTSLIGVETMRRLGLSAAAGLHKAVMKRSRDDTIVSRETMLDGTLAWVGSILLILPGFVSDFIGLALAAPSFRAWVAEKIQGGKPGARRRAPTLIELAPREWSRLEDHSVGRDRR